MSKIAIQPQLPNVSNVKAVGAARLHNKSQLDKTFADVLQEKHVERTQKAKTGSVAEEVTRFIADWDRGRATSKRLLADVPAEYRSFVELQLLVNDLNLRANLVSKVGETVTATINRVQQMGGN